LTIGDLTLGAREFLFTESRNVVSMADWVFQEAKDITSGGLGEVYGELTGLKTLFDQTYDGVKERGFPEVLSARDSISKAYLEVKLLGSDIVSETYLASRAVVSETRSGLKEGFSGLLLSDRTRDAVRGLGRAVDSVLLSAEVALSCQQRCPAL
jgi:hypothetical protein